MRALFLLVAFALVSTSCSRLADDRSPADFPTGDDVTVLAPLHLDRFGDRGQETELRIVRGDDAAGESVATDLLAQAPPLVICFRKRVGERARPDGRVTFTVRIVDDGSVSTVSESGVTTSDRPFVDCLAEALRTSSFHALDRPRTLVVPIDVTESSTSDSYP